jgi:Mu-like phage E16 protein
MYIGNQTARIHIGKARLGMDDDTYRAFLQRLTGKSSSKDMTVGERARVLAEMTNLGAFKDARRPLTRQQRACLGKWYELRKRGIVHSKDKSSFNRYIKRYFGKNNLADLADEETNTLYNMLEGWLQGATETT